MKHVLALADINNLELAKRIPVEEVLLQTASFSKTGMIEDERMSECLDQLAEAGKKATPTWDAPAKDKDIERLGKLLEGFADKISSIRFMDPGVGMFLKENFPRLELQFSLEFRNVNLSALLAWIEIFSPNLRRLILSNQVPISNIDEFQTETRRIFENRAQDKPEIELLGWGRLQIFHSARRPLRRHLSDDPKQSADLAVFSKENKSGGLCRTLENDRGTIMFHPLDLFIWDKREELEKAGVEALRFELWSRSQYQLLERCLSESDPPEEVKKNLSDGTTRGFFYENPTYRSLRQITNQVLQKEKEKQIGIVTEAVKKSHVLIEIYKELELPAKIRLVSPEGRKTDYQLETAIDLEGRKFSERLAPGYYLTPWINRSVPSAAITLQERPS